MTIVNRIRTYRTGRPQAVAQLGLSLIELMVGLTIGLVLTLGLFTLIASSSQAFKVQDDFARMQENATAALRYLGDSIRMAGFNGYSTDPSVIDNSIGGVTTTTDCGSTDNGPAANWALEVTTPVFGYPKLTSASVSTVFPCIKPANFKTGPGANPNPILVTRGAGGYRICNALVPPPGPPNCTNPNSLLTAQSNYQTAIYIQADPRGGLIFYGKDFATLKAAGSTRTLPNTNDVEIFDYHAYVYYLRPCSRPAAANGICAAGDDGGRPIPTLARQELVGSAMIEVPLVEGIDMIDYRFGIDNDKDGVADLYNPTPQPDDWSNVVEIKVSILVRSPTLSREYDDSGKQYDLAGDGGKTPPYVCTNDPDPRACQYKRKVFSRTFQLRNIAQRRGA